MKNCINIVLVISSIFLAIGAVQAGNGGGEIRIGYTFNDEDGDRSANQATFNYYEGAALSLERFAYQFDNGINLNADLKRISLNNRNLRFGLTRPGLFGLRVTNNQYRRIYSFNGDNFTRRNQTGGSLWIRPHRYVKLFGGASFYGKSGRSVEWYDLVDGGVPLAVDYKQKLFSGGAQINYQGGMVRGEFATTDFTFTEEFGNRSRSNMRFVGISPLLHKRAVVQAGFQRFETKYDGSGFELYNNTFWGGTTIRLPKDFGFNYNFIFDRASSDSDLAPTDNIAHTFYVSYIRPGLLNVNLGYQNGINDDFYDVVKSNSFYFSGWLKPCPRMKFKINHGIRAEKIDEGSRLVGEEDRTRLKISGQYNYPEYGAMQVKYQIRNRNNDDIGSKVDFSRISAEGVLTRLPCADITAGYSYSLGKYENLEQNYEFADHLVHGDISFREYKGLVLGFGAVYNRSQRDNDVESFTLNFTGLYLIPNGPGIEIKYNVHNFDDFLVRDNYYTTNIIEINLIKSISFKGDF